MCENSDDHGAGLMDQLYMWCKRHEIRISDLLFHLLQAFLVDIQCERHFAL